MTRTFINENHEALEKLDELLARPVYDGADSWQLADEKER
jgi:hypothetical protein